MDKLFLHICCGPCACFPLKWLKENRPETALYLWFYNPNIQPKSEHDRRRDTLAYLGNILKLTIDFSAPYEPAKFMAQLKLEDQRPPERCRLCYRLRFEAAAQKAKLLGYEYFSTTLSFSRRQNHELIMEEGQRAAKQAGLNFYYEDFRHGWKEGHELAKAYGLYRQNYCGCVFSEWEK